MYLQISNTLIFFISIRLFFRYPMKWLPIFFFTSQHLYSSVRMLPLANFLITQKFAIFERRGSLELHAAIWSATTSLLISNTFSMRRGYRKHAIIKYTFIIFSPGNMSVSYSSNVWVKNSDSRIGYNGSCTRLFFASIPLSSRNLQYYSLQYILMSLITFLYIVISSLLFTFACYLSKVRFL